MEKEFKYRDFEGDCYTGEEIMLYGVAVPVVFVLAIGFVASILGGC